MSQLEKVCRMFQSLGYTEIKIEGAYNWARPIGPKEYLLLEQPENNIMYKMMCFGDGIDRDLKFGYVMFGFSLVFTTEGVFVGHGAYE